MTDFAGNLDPKVVVEADVNQVFVVFFMTFSMATMALIHSSVVERIKAAPLLTMAVSSGSCSRRSPAICAGGPSARSRTAACTTSTASSRCTSSRARPASCSRGAQAPAGHRRRRQAVTRTAAGEPRDVGVGILLIIFALPFIAIGSGWLFPDVGFFGISMTTSGMGIVLINMLTSFCRRPVGTIIAYRRRQAAWIPLGALSSAILCGAMFDIMDPWVIILVSLFGPFVTMLGQASCSARHRRPEGRSARALQRRDGRDHHGLRRLGHPDGRLPRARGNTASSTPRSSRGGS